MKIYPHIVNTNQIMIMNLMNKLLKLNFFMFIQNAIYVMKISWLMYQSVIVHYLATRKLQGISHCFTSVNG